MLLSSPRQKKDSKTASESFKRISIRINRALIEEMSAHHPPKQKSKWVTEAIVDLLDRDIYKEADWNEADNEDTAAFMAMINLDEALRDPVAEVFLIPDSIFDELSAATNKVVRLFPSLSRFVRPAIIRAAIRQRLVLNGRRYKGLF